MSKKKLSKILFSLTLRVPPVGKQSIDFTLQFFFPGKIKPRFVNYGAKHLLRVQIVEMILYVNPKMESICYSRAISPSLS
jgi:hypothetical protein